jgi:hypothetical protein
MTPYRTRAIERDPAPRLSLRRVLYALDHWFTDKPWWWAIPAVAWFSFWIGWAAHVGWVKP